MAEKRLYAALGEESTRGIKESSIVGFVPLIEASIPAMEFDDKKRSEFRGDSPALGETAVLRTGRRWNCSMSIPFFTESGTAKGLMGTLLKHFFGKAASVQNGVTGQFSHMLYPVADPYAGANLGTKAMTVNLNLNQGAVMKNLPFVGGRVKGLSFEQETGSALKVGAELCGQFMDGATPEIGSPVYAAENLRCNHTGLSVYTGSITRTGTAPNYTDFSFAGAVRLRPDKLSLKLENGIEDAVRLSGLDYPDRTRMGRFKVTLELIIDWEDPASGFSSVSEFNGWMAGASSTSFFLHWDTGTQAGTGCNHGLYIDLPQMHRAGGSPEYAFDKDPMITLKYEALYSPATGYAAGVLLKNTSETI